MVLTSTVGEVFEVAVACGMVALVMGLMAAIPFFVQYYIEERDRPAEE